MNPKLRLRVRPLAMVPLVSMSLPLLLALVALSTSVCVVLSVETSTDPSSFSFANRFDNCLATSLKEECSDILFDPRRNDMDPEVQRVRACKLLDCQLRAYQSCLSTQRPTPMTELFNETKVYDRFRGILKGVPGQCPEFDLVTAVASSGGPNSTSGARPQQKQALKFVVTIAIACFHFACCMFSIQITFS